MENERKIVAQFRFTSNKNPTVVIFFSRLPTSSAARNQTDLYRLLLFLALVMILGVTFMVID